MKKEIVTMQMPTQSGVFIFSVWPGERGRELVALSTQRLDPKKEVIVRIHSECLTGDVFASQTCDCNAQKERALQMIQKHGNGIFIYHRQEGRNMGLYKKVRAYNLMQEGMDTHEANLTLVGHPDGRDYGDVLTVLDELLAGEKCRIRLLTNNPYKKLFLAKHGFSVCSEPLMPEPTEHSMAYIDTKKVKFLHGALGNEPYVGVTLYRNDLPKAHGLRKLIGVLDPLERGREVNFGIAIDNADLEDIFTRDINEFSRVFSGVSGLHIVLHVDYPASRSAYRDLQIFLANLQFRYALQFRLGKETGAKIDTELIDALHAECVIFQLKSAHFHLLDARDFREYFARPHRHILLDESFGQGRHEAFDVTKQKILQLISHGLSRVGVAGGYSGETVRRVFDLEDYFKIPISVDAQNKLRTRNVLSLEKVEKYLRAAINVDANRRAR